MKDCRLLGPATDWLAEGSRDSVQASDWLVERSLVPLLLGEPGDVFCARTAEPEVEGRGSGVVSGGAEGCMPAGGAEGSIPVVTGWKVRPGDATPSGECGSKLVVRAISSSAILHFYK